MADEGEIVAAISKGRDEHRAIGKKHEKNVTPSCFVAEAIAKETKAMVDAMSC
jgi:hypothetical protein